MQACRLQPHSCLLPLQLLQSKASSMRQGVRNEESRGSSMDSSSTASRGRNERPRRKVVLLRQPNREEYYEGPIRYCHHNMLAPRWTSWLEGNPGRRFYGCWNYYQGGGCGFFKWHDGLFGERENAVIKDLLTDIDKLYEENKQLRRGNACARLYEELVAIEGEVIKLKSKHEVKESEVKKVQLKFNLVLVALLVTWVVLVLMKL